MVLGGYSVLGDSIFSPLENRELEEIEEKLNEERTELSRGVSKRPTISLWLKKFMNSGSELEHEAFLRCGCAARGTRIALAPAVLASIYKDLSLLKCGIVDSSKLRTGCDYSIKLSIKSPFQFVQVWAWERFIEPCPNPGVINYGQPRLARWDKVSVLKLRLEEGFRLSRRWF
ncbi:hypothetical protein M0R45_015182 [Rubus argutus]|uniref:Aminotransferase-like plant mobile domain-containing protein n=1 Tax=Rubus argutus TaxID=59490 RepID=A0AAW1XNH2_RUBAR